MLPDRVSNLGPMTYESDALPIALRGPRANSVDLNEVAHYEPPHQDLRCLQIHLRSYMSNPTSANTVRHSISI